MTKTSCAPRITCSILVSVPAARWRDRSSGKLPGLIANPASLTGKYLQVNSRSSHRHRDGRRAEQIELRGLSDTIFAGLMSIFRSGFWFV